jgi:hypothetical protein
VQGKTGISRKSGGSFRSPQRSKWRKFEKIKPRHNKSRAIMALFLTLEWERILPDKPYGLASLNWMDHKKAAAKER